MTEGHTWKKASLHSGRVDRQSGLMIFVPPPPCMVVDEDLLKLGAAFYARRLMQPRPYRAPFICFQAQLFSNRVCYRRARRRSAFNSARLGGLNSSGSVVPNKIVHTYPMLASQWRGVRLEIGGGAKSKIGKRSRHVRRSE